jgi:predicted nucleotidyltransferase
LPRRVAADRVEPFLSLVQALQNRKVRFVLIGVAGANYYAHAATVVFTTQDRDLFLPPDPGNLEAAVQVCSNLGLSLWSGDEPLDTPRDRWLAERIVERRALVRASDGRGLDVDLTLVMAGFEFETVWAERRIFIAQGVEVPVARLAHIVESKAATGREKDRLFLATHADALRQLLSRKD